MFPARDQLHRRALRYIQTPKGREKFEEEFGTSLSVHLIISGIAVVCGLVMLPTIVFTKAGLQAVWAGLTLHSLQHDSDARYLKDPAGLAVFIAYGIIIGPTGHGLVLGLMEEDARVTPEDLASLARQLGDIYAEGTEDEELQPISELLQDDTFRLHRRRRLPEPLARGRALWLYDLELRTDEMGDGPLGTPLAFCLAAPECEDGKPSALMQLPWSLVELAES